jgi:hypothetical protein
MADFEIKISADAGQAVSAGQQTSAAFTEVKSSVAAATSEAERYIAALQRLAEEQAATKEAERQAADAASEKDRYRATLQRMEEEQAMRQGNQRNDDGWFENWRARRAEYLSSAETATEVTEKVAEAAAASNDWKKAMQALGREFPIVGAAAKLLANPLVGIGVAASMGFGLARQALAAWNEEMDKTEARNAERDWLPGIEAKAEAMRKGISDAAEWQRKLAEIAKEDAVGKAYSNALARLKEYVAGLEALTQAQQDRDLKRIDERLKKGEISESEAAAQKNKVREQYRVQGETEKTAGENAELKLMQDELAARKARSDELAKQTQANRDRFTAANSKQTSAAKQLPEYEEAYKAAKAAADAAGKYGNTHIEFGPDFEGTMVPKTVPGPDPNAVEAEKVALHQLELRRKLYERTKATAENAGAVGEKRDALASAEKEEADNREQIKRLEREVETLSQQLEVRQGFRKEVSGVKAASAKAGAFDDVAGTDAGKEVSTAAESADALMAGKEVNAKSKAQMQLVSQLLWGTATLTKEHIQMMSTFNDNLENLRVATAALEAKVKTTTVRLANQRAD